MEFGKQGCPRPRPTALSEELRGMSPTTYVVSAGACHTVALVTPSATGRDPHTSIPADEAGSDLRGISPQSSSSSTLYTWGGGEEGQLGHGDSDDRLHPTEVASLTEVPLSSVACGANHTIAVSSLRDEVYAWGWGDFGRLGIGDPSDVLVPTPIPALSGVAVAQVACGDSHCMVVATDGRLFTFGRNQNGQLGLGDTEDRLHPHVVQSLWDDGVKVRRAAGGAEHSAITVEGGEMYTFGWGRYGNLGHGHTNDVHVPTKVAGLAGQNVREPVCGWRHSAALTDEGRLWTFGWSKYGQLGLGDNVDHWEPVLLPEFQGGPITAASGGWRHMCALAGSTGTLYAWGWNQFGQLGIGNTKDANSPQRVIVGGDGGDDANGSNASGGARVTAVACGWRHTVAVAESLSDSAAPGEVFTWGRGVNGQLGLGDALQRNIPARVDALDLIRQGISVGVLVGGDVGGGSDLIGGGAGGGGKRPAETHLHELEVPSVTKKLHVDEREVPDAVP